MQAGNETRLKMFEKGIFGEETAGHMSLELREMNLYYKLMNINGLPTEFSIYFDVFLRLIMIPDDILDRRGAYYCLATVSALLLFAI